MKLSPKQPNLQDINRLYQIFKNDLKREMTYPQMVMLLYKSDKVKFQEAFRIVYGREFDNIGDEYVARLLLQAGLGVSKLLEYSILVRSKNGNK